MKQFIIALVLVFTSAVAFAQQDVQYTNFMYSKLSYNPGFAGLSEKICLTGIFRQQWMGYKGTDGEIGAPQTYSLLVNVPTPRLMGGLGLSLTQDKIGFENNISARLAYSFHLNLGDGVLGLGLQAGLINKKLDFTKFRPYDPADPIITGGSATESAMSFDLAFGAYYKGPNFYAGISSTQMQGFWGSSAEFASGLASPNYKNHLWITGGYQFQMQSLPSFMFEPQALIKTDFSSAQFDLNMLAWYNNKIYAGVSYRATDAVAVLAGMKISDDIQVGISYDITTSKMSKGTSGSFEVYARYCFAIVIPPKPYKHGTVLYL
jgi:type IX secretion system PorP/SprF family membrane protein